MKYYFSITVFILQIAIFCSGCAPTTPEGIVKKNMEIFTEVMESGKCSNSDLNYLANSWYDKEKSERIKNNFQNSNVSDELRQQGAVIKTKFNVSNAFIEDGIAKVDVDMEINVKLKNEQKTEQLPFTFYLQKNNNGEWKIIGGETR